MWRPSCGESSTESIVDAGLENLPRALCSPCLLGRRLAAHLWTLELGGCADRVRFGAPVLAALELFVHIKERDEPRDLVAVEAEFAPYG